MEEVGSNLPEVIIKTEPIPENLSNGDLVNGNFVPFFGELTQTASSISREDVSQDSEIDCKIPDLLVQVKREIESKSEIIYELVACNMGSAKPEPVNLESESDYKNSVIGHGFSCSHIQTILFDKISSVSAKVEKSTDVNNAQFLKSFRSVSNRYNDSCVRNCSVILEDIFSSDERRLGKAHANDKLCCCMYCQGEYKYVSPEKTSKPMVDFSNKQKSAFAVNAFNKHTESSIYLKQNSDTKILSGVQSGKRKCTDFGDCPRKSKRSLLTMNLRIGRSGSQHHFVSESFASDFSTELSSTSRGIQTAFKCDLCCAAFRHKHSLTLHKRKHGVKAVECLVCQTKFEYTYHLKEHMIDCHPNEKPYKCELCRATFQSFMQLESHSIVHCNERPYVCDQCPARFKRKKNLNSHLYSHTDVRLCECEECGKKFKNKGDLKKHKICHTSERPFRCKQCASTFKYRVALKQHLITHSNEQPYACSLCPAKLKTKTTLQSHLLGHSDNRPYKCKICEKKFISKSILNNHSIIHKPERPFECTQCSAKFKNNHNLKTHIIRRHTGERPFKCMQCSVSFKLSNDLRQHMRWHSNERPHACTLCPLKFKTNKHLKRHIISLHNTRRLYKCEQCSAKFKLSADLKSHSSVHNNDKLYSCHHCGALYKYKKTLKRHLGVHSDEKPFECETCSKKFPDVSRLRDHVRTHQKIKTRPKKLFECEFCPLKYESKMERNNHLKIHRYERLYRCEHCPAVFTTKGKIIPHLVKHNH